MSAPALAFGKFKGVPLPEVPANYIAFLLGKPDLYDSTRRQLEAEAKRRQADAGDQDADALPDALRADETEYLSSRCPHCGKRLAMTVSVAKPTR